MNIKIVKIMSAICLLMMGGCSLLGGGSKISNEQISRDLATKTLSGKNDKSLDLSGKYSSHCFQVTDSKFTGNTADVKLFLSATEIETGGSGGVKAVIGDVGLTYKKDGEKWTLDKVDSQDLDIKTFSVEEAISKFAPLAKPICASYSSSNDKK